MIVACSIACIAPITAFGVRYIPIGAQVTFYLLVFVANQTTLSGFNIAYMTYTLNMAPSMSRPTYIGFMNTLMFPMSFVPLLTGMLLRVMPYQVLFILSACLSLLGIYFARRLEDVEGLSDNVKKG